MEGPPALGPDLRVLRAPNPGPLTLDGTRTYLVGSSRLVVIDPGPAGPSGAAGEAAERLAAAVGGADVEAVCLTHAHPDHAGAAEAAATALGSPLAASAETLRRLGLSGRALSEGSELPVDEGRTSLRVLETPGHSADHLCFLWLPSRDLFAGDLVLGRGTSLIVHPDGRLGPYMATLARLVALRPSRILPGHGDPVGEPLAVLEEYRRHRLERTRQVAAALAAGAGSLDGVVRAVYGELPAGLRRAAELQVLAHVLHLAEAGARLPRELGDALRESLESSRGPAAEPGAESASETAPPAGADPSAGTGEAGAP